MTGAAITGVGMSQVGRQLYRPAIDLLADAALEALADAGLSRDEIDGIATYPGRSTNAPGMSPLGVADVRHALGLETRWHSATPEGPGQMSAIMVAAMAVATGRARHVLCFRALTESSSQTGERRASIPTGGAQRVEGWTSWLLPMNAVSASNWAAWAATRYAHEFGLTREQLGILAVQQRANAQHNPRALMHGKPLSLDDYLAARMISTPLCLFDCDIPIDGACCVIVSAADAAKNCRKVPLSIAAMGSACGPVESWDQPADLTRMMAHEAANDLWSRTDLTPADVDVAALYDGFSIMTLQWLEALGFCGHGEAGAFVGSGATAMGGQLPLNTGGGQLSAGRLHGFGHLHEACTQLWGEGGGRQVPDARVAAVGVGGGPLAGALLLAKAA